MKAAVLGALLGVAAGAVVTSSFAAGVGRAAAAPASQPQASGRELVAELGCGGCHAGLPDPRTAAERSPPLGSAGPALGADFVFDYLEDPVRRRDGIGRTRMPDFDLDEGERVALALYLGSSGQNAGRLGDARRRHGGVDAHRGADIFGVLGCAGCHRAANDVGPAGRSGNGVPPTGRPGNRVGPDLSREGARVRPEWLRAWIVDPTPVRSAAHPTAPGSRMPDFRLTAAEADAITAYLSSLGRTAASEAAGPPAVSAHGAARTERMLENRLACLGCHTLGGRGGGIGPSLDGAAQRLRPAFVAEMIADPANAAPGAPMPRQRMPRADAERLARLVLDGSTARPARPHRSLADPDHPAWTASPPGATTTGSGSDPAATLYARHCAACHGPTGGGDGWNATTLPVPPTRHADAAAMSARPDDTLFDGIHGGAWVLDGSPRMPAFGALLDADQIRSLVAYVRRLCACEQPAWAGDGGGR